MKNNVKWITSFDGELLFSQIFYKDDSIKQYFFLSHGLGGDSRALIPLAQQIVSTIHHSACVIWDLRLHGLSSNQFPSNFNSIEKVISSDLQNIITSYSAKNFYLIGHSFGGIASLEYLINDFTPKPQHLFCISSPIISVGNNWGRCFWFNQLKKAKDKVKKQRTLEDFLILSQGWDFDPKRILMDIKYTGLTSWIFTYLSLCGWENKHLEKTNSQQITFFYGKNDLILTKNKIEKELKKLPLTKSVLLDANHHQAPLTCYHQIAQKIKHQIDL